MEGVGKERKYQEERCQKEEETASEVAKTKAKREPQEGNESEREEDDDGDFEV